MGDLKFAELRKLADYRDKLAIPTRTPALQEVADAARENMGRVIDLAIFPDQIFNKAMLFLPMVHDRIQEVLQNEGLCTTEGQPLITVRTAYEIMIAFNDYVNIHPGEQPAHYSIERAFGGHCRDSLAMLMSSQIIGAWTAFEALATDAWVASVNLLPMGLGVNALLAKGRSKGTDSGENPDTGEKYTPMNIDILKEYRFDLKHSLGTMIWRKRKFDFNSLEGIGQAYQQTFCVRSAGSKTATPREVKGWFSGPGYPELKTLEAVRHVFAHRGGRADATFLERVEGHPIFGGLKPKDPVILDGSTVQELIVAAMDRAILLLEGVDKWIEANPE